MQITRPHALAAAALLCAAPLAAPLAAQTQRKLPFPMDPLGTDPSGLLVLRPRPEAVRSLGALDAVTLTGLRLPGGQRVDLEVDRIRHELLDLGFRVDGIPRPDLLAGLDLSVWRGRVAGEESSDVLLSFSSAGSRGWIRTGGSTLHLMPRPGEDGSWSTSRSLLVDERDLARLGMDLGFTCGTDLLSTLGPDELDAIPDGSGSTYGTSLQLYECKMAIETDYQLNQVFGGSLAAETAYVTSLLAASSGRYTEQIDTVLTYPYVQFYTNPGDPWSSQDGGGSSIDLLNEFQAAWSGNLPAGAVLAHFLSGASLGGGVAWLGVLCDTSQSFTFAVSGNINGSVPFPISQGPLNWDFMVFNHETGHNFGSPHTHDFCPPLDECAPSGYWGGCQDEQLCISDGTIMSYCHLCPGGTDNITTFFHPVAADVMRGDAQTCLPLAVGIDAQPPTMVPPGVPTTLSASVVGSPVGTVDLSYRFSPAASFQAIAMTAMGGGVYAADLPAPACGDQPEFFFGFVDASVGPVQTGVFTAEVGFELVSFADDFEADLGWSVGAPGDSATTGVWVRVDPIGTPAQPSSGTAGPFCYVTGQGSIGGGLGENDVDGGRTTLISPVLDLSGGDATISYWRWYSNGEGASPHADVFEVDVTNDGTTWVNAETVGPAGPETDGGWIYHAFQVSDFVAPTGQVRVRFVAADEGSGSIVEAALDDFLVFRPVCEVCQPDLGFGGPGTTVLTLCGPPLITGQSAPLEIASAPASSAAWIGFSLGFNPFPVLGGTIVTIPLIGVVGLTTDGSGQAALSVPGGPTALTVYFQAVVLDAGTGQFEISNALGAEFLP